MNSFCSYIVHIQLRQSEFLAKGYLPISLITPLKSQEILNSVKETLITTNPDYDIVIKSLHLYYDMRLVTFRIDRKKEPNNIISNFCAVLYTTTVNIILTGNSPSTHIVDKTTKADSYTQLLDKETIFSIKNRDVHKTFDNRN